MELGHRDPQRGAGGMIPFLPISLFLALLADADAGEDRLLRRTRVVTLPAGSRLFHGTIETFETPLRPGADGLVWFADSPKIAQLYIPQAGGTLYASPTWLIRPTRDPDAQALQRVLGIDYDMSQVEWDARGRLQSWPTAAGFGSRLVTEADVRERLVAHGFQPNRQGVYEVRIHDGRILDPSELVYGRLYVVTTTAPLRIFVKAEGDSDLLDLQYNDLAGFKDAEDAGFDGVLIDDFAQSKAQGNFGHQSLGLFRRALDRVAVTSVPAPYREYDRDARGTPEWPEEPISQPLK